VPGSRLPAMVFPLLAIGLLAVVLLRPTFIFFSTEGPGSQHAAIAASVGAGILLGILAQRSRLCFAGGIRDMLLIRSPHLLVGLLAALLAALVTNVALGQFKPGLSNQPVAHADHLWNFLGMALVGWSAVLLGGCPLRQLVLGAQGDGGAFCAIAGLMAGAALAHNFNLAASPAGVPVGGRVAVVAGLVVCLAVGWFSRET
jgi:uncharacterized protein